MLERRAWNREEAARLNSQPSFCGTSSRKRHAEEGSAAGRQARLEGVEAAGDDREAAMGVDIADDAEDVEAAGSVDELAAVAYALTRGATKDVFQPAVHGTAASAEMSGSGKRGSRGTAWTVPSG